jgi:microcystin-dependent protein
VTPNETYTAQFRSRAATTPRTVRPGLFFYDSAGAVISGLYATGGANTTSGWTQHTVTMTAPSNAAYARVIPLVQSPAIGEVHYIDAVMVEKALSAGSYFDGSTATAGGYTHAWTSTAHASSSTATSSNLAFIEPVPYLNVLGPTHDIKVVRESLNIGTLTATILDATLDPSQDDLIRPGRRVRLQALVGDVWETFFTGKATEASVTYHYKDPYVPDQKRARIVLEAVDATADLANQNRSEGVATIDDLPYVLEGCGVPWNVNGSGDQVPSAIVAAVNENASALDQIAVTRDSVLGHAWVDRLGVLQAHDDISAIGSGMIPRSAYSDIDLSYNTARCINEVWIKFLRYNPSTLQTEEVPYGPYRDETSIAAWGVRSAEFTVQGIAEETANLQAYADAILAANGTPEVRCNSVTVPIGVPEFLAVAVNDLAFTMSVEKPDGSATFFEDAVIDRMEHSITPDKWMVRVAFGTLGQVASPTFVPSPQTGAEGQTIGQLLRPVGEVTMFGGASAPAGWLICDGSSKLVADYPDLHAAIGYSHGGAGASFNLPNFTDRFPIGTGTKAIGTSGGASTKTIAEANLPAHDHGAGTLGTPTTASATGSGSRLARGTASSAADFSGFIGRTGNTGSGTALDVMNPWRAITFIIRAV